MRAFDFATVPHIHVQWGGAARLGELMKGWFPAGRVLVVTDRFLHGSGLLNEALASLATHGYPAVVFDAVEADPAESIVRDCVLLATRERADIVVGLGGGSSMDVAKVAAAIARSGQPISEAYGIGNLRAGRLSLVQVPTTAGTGSEVTRISILTTPESTKLGIVADTLYADRVLLDASLTVGLPAVHTAATGIDAMVHAIEAYTSQHLKNPLSDMLAREALKLLSGNLLAVCDDGTDADAREAMLLGSMLAGQAFANAPVAAVHALAYPLGGRFHIPHGLSNALMLGPVLAYNRAGAARLYAELGEVLGHPRTGKDDADAQAFIDGILALVERSGAPRRLRDVDIPRDALPMLAADAMKQTRLLVNNPVPVDEPAALAIYEQAY
ncbi:MAG: iron-containing alcohol dehydrogenase [Aquamicrobium sp.]|nr:iron-containing alcohol dehydrogenase [Aquamicrobium sp.]